MSDIYTLPALVESYGLTIDQWFDKRWNLQDPFKLPYYFRGRRVNLIRGTGKFPERFEVQPVSFAEPGLPERAKTNVQPILLRDLDHHFPPTSM